MPVVYRFDHERSARLMEDLLLAMPPDRADTVLETLRERVRSAGWAERRDAGKVDAITHLAG